ncbi:MAG: ATP-binding protein [Candidatus Dormibacteraeota bacterium]|nr:ATP-binding protein [Candidatus Dormibacteraeota bacterium]
MAALTFPTPVQSPIALPPPPRTLEETGLPASFIGDLVLKVLYFNGTMMGRDIAVHICISFGLVESALKFLGDEGYVAAIGVRLDDLKPGEPMNAGMMYQISSTGRQRARELLDLNQYAGPAPVPIGEYAAMAEQQATVDGAINRSRMHEAFGHLVLPDVVLDHLGPALSAREAVFLYGPPGNGKTTIAEAAAVLMGPPLFVPRALYVHGEVIRFFDPIHHKPINRELPPHDMRWQLVQRPAVKVGGELTARMLDLSFDSTLGFYEASMQLKANGGLFLIDDFGRQQNMSPRDLLNRLIVPLEQRRDYVNISRAGTTVAVPFTCLLILSTNMRPQNLMDEAFLRRVHFKVRVPDPTEQDFREIWRRRCAAEGLPLDQAVITRLIARHYTPTGRAMHGSHPRDLLTHIVHAARYFGLPVEVNDELMDWACDTYFVDEDS